MMRRLFLSVAVAAMLTLASASEVHAWGARHVGYTHVGPNGVYHAGRTVGYGPGGGFSTGHAGAYGYGGNSYHAGYGYGATRGYGGYNYGGYGGYHYSTAHYGSYYGNTVRPAYMYP
ncbi:MAG: hypothetical protein K8T89_22335 [Planctomycetes bacterium]|nr:hypothetical protein [Planctomycetota bacterium]